MPKIAIFRNLVFFIVSYDLREWYHLHVVKTKGSRGRAAKIWLNPVEVFEKGNLTAVETNMVLKLVEANKRI